MEKDVLEVLLLPGAKRPCRPWKGVAERSESFKIMIAGGNHSMVKKPRTQKILANIIHRSTRLRGRRLRRSGRLLGDPYRACAIHEMLAKIQRCGRLRASPTECGGKRRLQQPTGYTPSVSPFGLTAPPKVEPRALRAVYHCRSATIITIRLSE